MNRPTDAQLADLLESSARSPLAAKLAELLASDKVARLERENREVRELAAVVREMVGVSLSASGRVLLLIGEVCAALRAGSEAKTEQGG